MTAARPRFTRTPLSEQAPPSPALPEIARRLAERYLPTPPTPRQAAEPLDGLISTILSQQNTAPITRRQFAGLKAAYPGWEAALADGPDGIEAVLKAAGGGLSRIKADYIWNVLHQLEETRGGLSLKDTRRMNDAEVRALLQSLPGVGMKTASCVLLFDLARPAMPVDTHIWRLARRLELVPGSWNAVKVEQWFDEVLPRSWKGRYTFHVAAIRHGRETCKAQRPLCGECVLRELCPSAGIFLSEAPGR
ncbi:Fe-S cluster assembly protein HesB [Deinococcus irradiatisoli]|uniref:Fe-S cluster assembly protein HesB n=1 Tax=Deinococcus irradiatisoli TaxID=2202254 RepID=A0A2Z3JIY8_9DEIO|nr:endonuclease III [Deinococcus irradiatisoli]AWN23956.1 Fe-S cluster assembly protein HesB [Deinococcus irradiatisoli]